MTDTLNLAVIGGDGIGPEVVAEGLKVLDAVTAAGRGTRASRRGSSSGDCCSGCASSSTTT